MSLHRETEDALPDSPQPTKRRRIAPSLAEDLPPLLDTNRDGEKKPNTVTPCAENSRKTAKPKHRIHVPANPSTLPETWLTQDSPSKSSSPYRIRGPRWLKKPKVSAVAEGREVAGPVGQQPLDVMQHPPIVKENEHFINFAEELADLPSDAFASSSASPEKANNEVFVVPSQSMASPSKRIGISPQNGLRQTTLFGGTVQQLSSDSQSSNRHSWPLANRDEPATHHKLNQEAIQTWVYPTNLGTTRDYQYNIVSRGLYHNLLVALPTGLGKTFIAATVMLNWFRWTKDAQLVFVAPTKPLVSQQVNACFGIAGIPRSQTSMLTGGVAPGLRAEEWASKRVFFMTPQTIINDLKTGICDPKKIVLLVVDEAHRATGAYAYVEVVKFMRRFNTSFRVLALTATPGASVEAVQEVIDGLDISRVEIRTEFSLDIRQYVHQRNTETIVFDNSEEMVMVMDLFSKALQPVLNKLSGQNAYWSRDPMSLTPYGLTQARQKWMLSDAGRKAPMGLKAMVNGIFTVLASLAHSIDLLKYHGIGPFYHSLVNFRHQVNDGGNGTKYRKQINEDENFIKLMNRLRSWVSDPAFIGHPKLDYLQGVVLSHFVDAGEGQGTAQGAPPSSTRVMIFAHYRDSAEEIVRVLKRNEPMVRPHVFVGQAAAKGSEGMDQKRQLDIIQKFKAGTYNTLVATSIGEEGLDIGEIDLIVCYDSSASPIRMLQRMGRTGRKRAGNIILLLMRGKEEKSFTQAKDNYEKMQGLIAAGTRFKFHDDRSPRILPRDVHPVVDKRIVDIPLENSQPELPEPKKRGRAPKRPPKKFHMPDGVRSGFVRASRLGGEGDDVSDGNQPKSRAKDRKARSVVESEPGPEPIDVPPLCDVLLTCAEEKELERKYQYVYDGAEVQTVAPPRVDQYPERQRSLGRTHFVRHGRASTAAARLFARLHNIDEEVIDQYQRNLRMEDVEHTGRETLSLESEVEPEDLNTTSAQQSRSGAKSCLQEHARRTQKRATVSKRAKGVRAPRSRNAANFEMSPMEAEDSSPPATDPRLRLQSQGISLGSSSRIAEEDEEREETDSDLDGFVVDDGEEIEEREGTVTSSIPIADVITKSFYVSQRSILSGSDDDLPEVDALVTGEVWKPKEGLTVCQDTGRKRRRNVVEDDSDD